MTYKEALQRCRFGGVNKIADLRTRIEYETAVESALKRQIPIAPDEHDGGFWCECGKFLVGYNNGRPHHCKCGQAIDWRCVDAN